MQGESGDRRWRPAALVVLALVLLGITTWAGVDGTQHTLRIVGQSTRVLVALALLVIAVAPSDTG
jgi:hypothetical protein